MTWVIMFGKFTGSLSEHTQDHGPFDSAWELLFSDFIKGNILPYMHLVVSLLPGYWPLLRLVNQSKADPRRQNLSSGPPFLKNSRRACVFQFYGRLQARFGTRAITLPAPQESLEAIAAEFDQFRKYTQAQSPLPTGYVPISNVRSRLLFFGGCDCRVRDCIAFLQLIS